MNRVPVQSRLIHSVAYNEQSETLHVWFHNGRHRAHHGIPSSQVSALIEAQSPGFYYSYYIHTPDPLARITPFWAPRVTALLVAVTLVMLPS